MSDHLLDLRSYGDRTSKCDSGLSGAGATPVRLRDVAANQGLRQALLSNVLGFTLYGN